MTAAVPVPTELDVSVLGATAHDVDPVQVGALVTDVDVLLEQLAGDWVVDGGERRW